MLLAKRNLFMYCMYRLFRAVYLYIQSLFWMMCGMTKTLHSLQSCGLPKCQVFHAVYRRKLLPQDVARPCDFILDHKSFSPLGYLVDKHWSLYCIDESWVYFTFTPDQTLADLAEHSTAPNVLERIAIPQLQFLFARYVGRVTHAAFLEFMASNAIEQQQASSCRAVFVQGCPRSPVALRRALEMCEAQDDVFLLEPSDALRQAVSLRITQAKSEKLQSALLRYLLRPAAFTEGGGLSKSFVFGESVENRENAPIRTIVAFTESAAPLVPRSCVPFPVSKRMQLFHSDIDLSVSAWYSQLTYPSDADSLSSHLLEIRLLAPDWLVRLLGFANIHERLFPVLQPRDALDVAAYLAIDCISNARDYDERIELGDSVIDQSLVDLIAGRSVLFNDLCRTMDVAPQFE